MMLFHEAWVLETGMLLQKSSGAFSINLHERLLPGVLGRWVAYGEQHWHSDEYWTIVDIKRGPGNEVFLYLAGSEGSRGWTNDKGYRHLERLEKIIQSVTSS